jgi:thiol-disulfide isomerase/thioredoxin
MTVALASVRGGGFFCWNGEKIAMTRIAALHRLLQMAVASGWLLAAGCGFTASDTKVTAHPPGQQLLVGDGQKLRDLIAAHKGQVVFVDYWATWCEPCVAAFPHTVEISRKYKDKGLATIAVSYDELADKEKVVKFLADQGAHFENLLSSYDGVGTEAAKDFDVEVLPTFLLYDKQGKLRHKWEEKAADIEQKIEALLAE